jgi:hypothetical protein
LLKEEIDERGKKVESIKAKLCVSDILRLVTMMFRDTKIAEKYTKGSSATFLA